MPQTTHMTRLNPTLPPQYRSIPVGDMKMPDPIMLPLKT